MSLEVFEKLEEKYSRRLIPSPVADGNRRAERKKQLTVAGSSNAQHQREELERENNHLKEQQNGWQERLQALLGRMEEV